MKLFIASLALTGALLLVKCGPSTTVIEIKSGKHGGLFEVSDTGTEYKFYNSTQVIKVNTSTSISFADFDRIQTENSSQGLYVINFKLNESGTLKFKQMTDRNLQKQVCFIVNNTVMATPIIQGVITNGFVSLTLADKKNVDDIIKYLEN